MGFTVGRLAEEVGVNPETVRYYERRGLLSPPARTPSGYRTYGPDDVWRLSFIKRAQSYGFTLAEIGELLAEREQGAGQESVMARIRAKLAQIDEDAKLLEARRCQLGRLLTICAEGDATSCLDLASERA